ncbi:MAG: macro domain-containing protein [Planctomycetota bacterium]|jgi:putative ATPase
MPDVLLEFRAPGGTLIAIVCGDLTEERVDAIVNAANSRLAHGGGVAGAIAGKGGPSIQQESRDWVREHGEVPTGGAAITGAGRLPAGKVIHAVGPVWGSGDEDEKLAAAVRSALALAVENGLRRVSLPAISSGIFGFPKDRCARIILETVTSFRGLDEIRLCNLDEPTVAVFLAAAERYRTAGSA